MNSGNIILSTDPSSFVSGFIRWFTSSKFSHSFITMPDILGIPTCIEAAEGGVDMSRFDTNYLNNTQHAAMQIWQVNVPQTVKDQAMIQILNDLEITYGFLEYPFFVWRKLNMLFGRDIKGQKNWNQNGMICSQLVVAYLNACGLQNIFAGYGQGSVSPQDLFVIFNAHPELFTLIQTIRM